MAKHPRSHCCDAIAKIDRTSATPQYFCTACVKTCALKDAKPAFGQPGQPRKVTGERKLMEALYEAQGGKCAVSGRDLWPPTHPLFHHQGSHILPKGTYPEDRLLEGNMVMVRKFYHDQWEHEKDKEKLVRIEPRWKPHVETYHRLFREAQQHNRPWDSLKKT